MNAETSKQSTDEKNLHRGISERTHSSRTYHRRKLKKIRRIIIIILFIALILSLFCWFEYPKKDISDGVITRDFTEKTLFLPELPQIKRDSIWDSELPKIVERDIKKAMQEKLTIRYSIGNSILEIDFDENKPILEISSKDLWAISSFNTLRDFSIYKKKNDLYVYGINAQLSDIFEEYIFYSDYSKSPESETLTYDNNLPFSAIDKAIGTLTLSDYSLYYDKEQTFYFYKKGNFISSKKFPDAIETIKLYDGLILTKNNMLYLIYAYEKDGVPDLKFVFVADGVELLKDSKYSYSMPRLTPSNKEQVYLPILKLDGQYHTIIPNNWDDFDKFFVANETLNPYERGTDYGVKFVKIEDIFESARFKYKYDNSWEVTLNFNVNGSLYSYDEYYFNGYDSTIELSKEDCDKLSVTVKSIEDLKNHIETIRKVYPSYYSFP